MSIRTPKLSSRTDFYEVSDFIDEIKWLKNHDYNKAILELWSEYTSVEERSAIMTLLYRLTHHTIENRHEAVDYLVKIITEENLQPTDTLIIATSDGTDSDGSIANLHLFKAPLAKYDWSERNLKPTFCASYDELKKGAVKNVIIFDDFIGSGKTIKDKIVEFEEEMAYQNINNINILIFSFVGMEFGIEYAEKYCDKKIYCHTKLKKGISEYHDEHKTDFINTVEGMERKLKSDWKGLKLRDFRLGYKGSETIYQYYLSNCSNNVFPIFWWPKAKYGVNRITLFNRLR